jgi:hypothetical protein
MSARMEQECKSSMTDKDDRIKSMYFYGTGKTTGRPTPGICSLGSHSWISRAGFGGKIKDRPSGRWRKPFQQDRVNQAIDTRPGMKAG